MSVVGFGGFTNHNMGSVLWRRKNDLVAAEAAFRAAIAADSSYVDARRNLEVLCIEMLSEKQLVGVLIGDKLAVEMRQKPGGSSMLLYQGS
jgi:hypothetical protein